MAFYSTVAIVIGFLGIISGIYSIASKNIVINKKKKYIDPKKYLYISSISTLIIGLLLLVSGIISFILDYDFVFVVIFTSLLVVYFIVDLVLNKTLLEKNIQNKK